MRSAGHESRHPRRHEVAVLGEARRRWSSRIVGIALAYLMLFIRHPALPQLARAPMAAALSVPAATNGTSTSSTTALFVRPAHLLGYGLWKAGDGDDHRRRRARRHRRACSQDRARQRRARLQSGYVYHYAFAMLIGVVLLITWYPVRAVAVDAMSDLPHSDDRHLPAAASARCSSSAAARRRRSVARNARWASRCGPRSLTFAAVAGAVVRLRPRARPASSSRSSRTGCRRFSIVYRMGVDGISDAVRAC